jgi:uncharacterized GH25 family protein
VKSGYVPSLPAVVELETAKTIVRSIELDPLLKIFGRVLDETNQPVDRAKVSVDFMARTSSAELNRLLSEQGRSVLSTTTNSKGEFEILLPPQERGITLLASMLGYARARVGPLTLETARVRMGIVLRLSPGLAATGRVVNEKGEPIKDALVRAHNSLETSELDEMEPRATSGLEGKFVLRGLEKGVYKLKVTHAGHATKVVSKVEIAPETTNTLADVVLEPNEEIKGRVAEADGQPISGAKVSAFAGELNTAEAISDEKGAFFLSGFARGSRVHLTATSSGHASATKTVSAPNQDVAIVLLRRGTLRGRVEEAQSLTPIRSFAMRIGLGSTSKTFLQDDGNFEWNELPPGRWSFTVSAPGYQTLEMSDVEIRPGESTEVVFALERGVELAGRVVDAQSGAGVPNVSVNYTDASMDRSPEWYFYSMPIAQKTDADGRFKFDTLPRAKITLIARAPQYAEARQTVVAGEDRFIEIKLSRGSFISGRVVASDTITPAAGAAVSLLNKADMTAVTIPADGNGNFYFGDVTPGQYRVSAESKSGQTNSQEVLLRENEQLKDVVLVVKSGATIRGKVSGLRPDESKIVQIIVQASDDFLRNTSTLVDGTYVVRGVPAGPVRVTAQTSRRAISRSSEIPESSAEISVDIKFANAGRLSGRITRAGKPVPNETIKAWSRDVEAITGSGQTDANGFYVIDGLSENTYEISFGSGSSKSVWISGDTVLDVELPAHSVSGRVAEDKSGQSLSGVLVQVQGLKPATGARTFASATTDSSGNFNVEGLDAGQYELIAQKHGFRVASEMLVVPVLSPVLLSLSASEGIPIRVRDGINGMALRSTAVQVVNGTSRIDLSVALDENGNGEIPQLGTGRYDLRVSSAGYADKSIPGWTVPSSPLDILLTPGGRLEIRADARYVGSSASLMEQGDFSFNSSEFEFRLLPWTVLSNLSPGEYVLAVKTAEDTKKYKIGISEGKTTVLLIK